MSSATAGVRPRAGRVDAAAKVTGAIRYTADIDLPGLAHAAVVRAALPHAAITGIDTAEAAAAEGVVGVFTAADVDARLFGRKIADMPLLARDKVRFIGERVALVVAETRRQAEAAAQLVSVDYAELPAVVTITDALAPGAPLVHQEPWSYEGALVRPGDGPNWIHHAEHGSLEEAEEALAGAAHVIDRRYTTQSVHQGYLEPQACVADYESAGRVRVWLSNKMPYRSREIVGKSLGLDPHVIEFQPVPVGGDFGGKGSPHDAVACVELSRLTGRPVKLVARYDEDLTAVNPRHPSEYRVRLGCDGDGHLVAAAIEARFNGGAYGAFTPRGITPHSGGVVASYHVPVFYSCVTRVYTNTVPRGNMRAPGAPQGVFAFESAMDELAVEADLHPLEFRIANLLKTGDHDTDHQRWIEHRGLETVEAALGALELAEPPEGWLYGSACVIYSRPMSPTASTSMRLTPLDDGCVQVETPITETGAGMHTALREMIAEQLGYDSDDVKVVAASTGDLPHDAGVGGSRVTAGLATAVDIAAKLWLNRDGDEPVVVDVNQPIDPRVGSYLVQIAQVAVDPESGELKVLEILSAADVARIVNPVAHQMQIDGGMVMGFGQACLEDLGESEGEIWGANMGEYRLPSARDVPPHKTVLVPGGIGVGTANVKNIGEQTTPPVPAVIANAVYDATGCRIRELPLTAERIYQALRERG
jgi:CO/xanthine dehydrogenase Mo-binding subunit